MDLSEILVLEIPSGFLTVTSSDEVTSVSDIFLVKRVHEKTRKNHSRVVTFISQNAFSAAVKLILKY